LTDFKGLAVKRVRPVYRAYKVLRESEDLLVLRADKESVVFRENKARRVRLVRKACRVYRDHRAQSVHKVRKVRKVILDPKEK
jgi:hypothetical protein